MPGVNKFLGGMMSQRTISAYYPAADFKRFIFQPMITGIQPDNRYPLFAYVEKTAGPPIPLGQLPESNQTFEAHTVVQFANMYLDGNGLANLYPNGVNVDLPINPIGYYPANPNYIAYSAQTPNGLHPLTITYPINPSPPA